MLDRRTLLRSTAGVAAATTASAVAAPAIGTPGTGQTTGQTTGASTGQTTGPAAKTRRRRGAAGTLALIEKGVNRLSFFDVATGVRESSIQMPTYPHEMAIDSRRRYGYVGHYGVRMGSDPGEGGAAVLAVDLHRRRILNTIDTAPYNRIHGVGVDGRDRVYALSEADSMLMHLARPRTASRPSSAVPTGGTKTHMFVVTRDGQRAFVTGLDSGTVSLVHPHDPTRVPLVIAPGQGPEGCSLNRNESILYVGARRSSEVLAIDTASMEVVGRAPVAGDPLRVYARPDGTLLMSNIADNTVSCLDGTSLSTRWQMEFAGTPAGISFHPRGNLAYVSQFVTNEIAVVDLERQEVVTSFATDLDPDSSAILLRN